MHYFNVVLCPEKNKLPYLQGNFVQPHFYLFDECPTGNEDDAYALSYHKMQQLIAATPYQAHINLYAARMDMLLRGAVDGFIQYRSRSSRRLLVWKIDSIQKDSRAWSYYQHAIE
ncbi:hypothetical protein WJ0W_006834 [Paenibacillus melissococcoides]|uniref:Uncharacterized protein n=1 Tax=Paenibacillus melissococcoides TaxID=2912268 RepID=A0ABN8UEV4_9BACL|nr:MULTISPECIES: hypothetical protein [Paenibacillus]MEB9895801.1 hypothetical protein [Bacillus cereus]CAH8249649.1 hypothetical protein WJ0W_006834 [Paenibacillus melissococcoides]CAH8721461.1 hypothetical protein WDD9_006305 [Paenibacillus melissococcoides]CAH8721758.1 hypothetical protein HTL2_006521 [Paenibacillus melissococcoides]GIO80766.1 hypothetical protein J6TS7_43760 [Paenibacillus dendritiformis]